MIVFVRGPSGSSCRGSAMVSARSTLIQWTRPLSTRTRLGVDLPAHAEPNPFSRNPRALTTGSQPSADSLGVVPPVSVAQSRAIPIGVDAAYRATLQMELARLFRRWYGPIPPIKEVRARPARGKHPARLVRSP